MKMKCMCLLLLAVATQGTEPGIDPPQKDPEDVTDGYALATVHIMDPDTNQTVGRSKREIEALATGSSAVTPIFLDLSTGERLNMTLFRRTIDTSGGEMFVINEDGSSEKVPLPSADCFFSGSLQNDEGFANLALCDGEMMGSIQTDSRQYEIHMLPHISNQNTVMRVLVTWRNVDQRSDTDDMTRRIQDNIVQQAAENEDGLETTEDDDEEPGNRTISRIARGAGPNYKRKRLTVEIADVVDSHYISELRERKGIKKKDVAKFIINKWSGAASILSNRRKAGWHITLRLVALHIWRKNPKWYKTKHSDRLITRMSMICDRLGGKAYDHIMVHTGAPITAKGRIGVAWIGKVCGGNLKCASSRSFNSHFAYELHEFGHSLGLKHDQQMPGCSKDGDQLGFMKNRPYFRRCYKEVLEKTFNSPKRTCIFRNDHRGFVREF